MLQDLNRRIQQITLLRCPNGKNKDGTVKPWALIDCQKNDYSYDLAYEVPIGYSVKDLEQETDSISASVGAHVEIKNRGGVVVVSIARKDFTDRIDYSHELLELSKDRQVLLGFTRTMEPVTHDFRVPHLLVGGMSGYGKTDLIRWIIYQLITRYSPDQLEIYIIDLKGFSFLPFRDIPHIKSIGRNLAHAYIILKEAVQEMNLRSNEIWDSGDRQSAKIYPWRIILIDEAAQISPDHFRGDADKKKMAQECDTLAGEISCVGREAGVGLIYCTQRPDAKTVNPQVKANADASICFRTKNRTNSEIIIGKPGAENLPEKTPGRLIYSTTTDTILQVPFIGDDYAWEQLLNPYTKQGRNIVNEQESTIQTEYTQLYVPNSDSRHEPDNKVYDWSHFPREASIRNHVKSQRR